MGERTPDFAEELETETFGLPEDEVTPSAIRKLPRLRGLRLVAREARLGGKLTGHITRLTDEEHEERAARAKAFLEQPAVEYPADDAAHQGPE